MQRPTPVGPPPPPINALVTRKRAKIQSNEKPLLKIANDAVPFRYWETPIEWDKVSDVRVSNNEDAPVFFIESQLPKHYAVIKCSPSPASELFGNQFAHLLHVPAPHMELLEHDSPDERHEYRVCREMFLRMQDEIHKLRSKNLTSKFYIKMELISPSCTLECIPSDHLNNLNSPKLLKNLGRLIALDILMNNGDRIPVGDLWGNQGNPNNVLYSQNEIQFVAIDQPCISISNDQLRQKYFENVSKLYGRLRADDHTSIDSIVLFFKEHTGYEIENRASIVQGMLDVNVSERDIIDLKVKIEQAKQGKDHVGVYESSLAQIDVDFICKILNCMKE
jgi:hypothetical protein